MRCSIAWSSRRRVRSNRSFTVVWGVARRAGIGITSVAPLHMESSRRSTIATKTVNCKTQPTRELLAAGRAVVTDQKEEYVTCLTNGPAC